MVRLEGLDIGTAAGDKARVAGDKEPVAVPVVGIGLEHPEVVDSGNIL